MPEAKDESLTSDEATANPLAEYNARVQEWIAEKWGEGGRCPMCGVRQWSILPIAELAIRPFGPIAVGMAFQVVPIACTNCWFTPLLLAGPLGVFQNPQTGSQTP
jgi:hypothetical protein